MKMRISKDVDLAALSKELTASLGRPVALNLENGEITLLDERGQPTDADRATVEGAIRDHQPQARPVSKSPAETLAADLQSATTIAEVQGAVMAYARTLVEIEGRRSAARQGAGRP